jgi:hypothetical protein
MKIDFHSNSCLLVLFYKADQYLSVYRCRFFLGVQVWSFTRWPPGCNGEREFGAFFRSYHLASILSFSRECLPTDADNFKV